MKIVAFDTETTGLIDNRTMKNDKLPEIIELYACRFDDKTGKVDKELDLLIRPTIAKELSEETLRVTGITYDMFAGKKQFKEYATAIKLFLLSGDAITGHNLSYDTELIEIEFDRVGMNHVDGLWIWPRLICTVEQTVHMRGIRLSLTALHEYLFGEPFSGAHRAKTDVQAQVRCFLELKRRGEL